MLTGINRKYALCERVFSEIFTERGYSLVFNNCEHFARWCKAGRSQSKQVDEVIDIVVRGIKEGVDILNRTQNPKETRKLELFYR